MVLAAAGPTDAALAPVARARMIGSGRVGPDVIAHLETQASVRVMVAFALPGGTLPADLGVPEAVRAVAAARAALVASVPPDHLRVRRAFHAVDALAADVDADGVLALLARPEVRRIDFDGGGT